QPEVMSLLKTKNLPWRSPTRTNSVDKVVEQRPGAGVLWDRRQPMDLVWHVPVPELAGMALARGRDRLAELDLRIEVQTRLARDPDVIRGQQPRAGTFVPHGSRVVVGPVLGRVPRVVGQGVGPAAALLTDREDYPAERLGPLLDSDIVTRQNPQAGAEYERGRTVTLDARVTVPNVRGQNLDRALQAVRSAGGALAPVVAGASGRGDVVFSQQPGPNELVYPRTTVTLVPGVQVPDVRRQTPQQAAAILASAGLDSQVVSSSTQETTNRAQVGATVVDNQRPGPGLYRRTDVRRVELSVVQFVPATRVVPNVIEFTVQQAIAAIKRAELVPIIVVDGREMNEATFAAYALTQTILQEGGNSSVYQLTVGTQNPRAGASVMLGSQVRIGVALPRY
ncbi:MAG TPA: PASTA domain-containing protein, partial [Lacipirellulaceae bacterium]|nr:PASTA domain-containing protein [Lacipirellulaceae bacterium]